MMSSISQVPRPSCEPVRQYVPESAEATRLQATLSQMKHTVQDIPMYIGGEEVHTKQTLPIHPPHERHHLLGNFCLGDGTHVRKAIRAALDAKKDWENLPWEARAGVFLRAAELVAGPYRDSLNAATMLGQSKNVMQAELDAACEFIDFLRFNAQFYQDILSQQPLSTSQVWNSIDYRPLEGFVLAITPFNFTSIAGNLACAPALLGNTVVWKPAYPQVYSAQVIMEVLTKAGLPDGVINLIYAEGEDVGKEVFPHPEFAGLHFTGSTQVFKKLWKEIGKNVGLYKSYPRVVGETGGKDFIVAHASADLEELMVGIVRGGFEYQGQKCSAASRVYVPDSLWHRLKKRLLEELDKIKMGSVEDFSCLMNAVISPVAYEKIKGYVEKAKRDADVELLYGGGCSDKEGYFVEPTLLQARRPDYTTMCEEIFGPVVTVYVYPEKDYEKTLALADNTSPYALTGAVFAQDKYAVQLAHQHLRHAAGNFYVNDKPTGAVVGQQPFGGGRASGTNDKAGSVLNLHRWLSPRTIKEQLAPPHQVGYPHMGAGGG